ncbi:MAG: HD domain-containing protein [Firmicutes bacterium]|nr:HD domain-containing protein [Bacillota bacterium]
MDEAQITKKLEKLLSPRLFAHCRGTADTAEVLARTLQVDVKKARSAAWLHDCTREWPDDKLLQYARKCSIPVDDYTANEPVLLHGPVGAAVAKEWGITDEKVLSAISNHTLGFPGMPLLDQIIYLADKIEPNRCYPGVAEMRRVSEFDFSKALRLATANTITYLLSKEKIIHPRTIAYWNNLAQNIARGV